MLQPSRWISRVRTGVDQRCLLWQIKRFCRETGGVHVTEDAWDGYLLGEVRQFEPNLRRYMPYAYERLWKIAADDFGCEAAPKPKLTLVVTPEDSVGLQAVPQDGFPEPAILPEMRMILMGGTRQDPGGMAWRVTRGLSLFVLLDRLKPPDDAFRHVLLHACTLYLAARLYDCEGWTPCRSTLDVRDASETMAERGLVEVAAVDLERVAPAVQTSCVNLMALFLCFLREQGLWHPHVPTWAVSLIRDPDRPAAGPAAPAPAGRPWRELETNLVTWLTQAGRNAT